MVKLKPGKFKQFGVCALLAAASCSPAFAQRGATAGGGVRVSAPAVRVSSPSIRTAPVQRISFGQRSNITLNGAPGLGFDYAHLAAISRAQQTGSRHVRFNGGLTPFSPFGFSSFVGLPVGVIQQPVMVEPEPVEGDNSASPAAAPQQYQVIQAGPQRDNVDPPLPPPTQDTREYVLVKRDGAIVFAVAFTSDARQLTYVTREGARHSIPLSQLDAETTRQMNNERGTSIQLPN
jgi:hypothetical protein